MKSILCKKQEISLILDLIVNIIRGLGQIAETLILSLNPVDGSPSKAFSVFSLSLMQKIIDNLGFENYPTKNRCRILTSPLIQRVVLPIS